MNAKMKADTVCEVKTKLLQIRGLGFCLAPLLNSDVARHEHSSFLRECRREQKPAYLYHSAGPCKSLFPICRILSAERLARDNALHDLRRAVADL